MGAAAPARKAPVRPAPARPRTGTTAPRRSPHLVGRTAVRVRALPDSGLMVQMTRGRAWIVVLSGMLAGIVALNVINLSFSASEGKLSQQAQVLEQENSVLRARLALRLSNGRVRSAAAALGMTAPSPTDIAYRDASRQSTRLAGKSLEASNSSQTAVGVAPG